MKRKIAEVWETDEYEKFKFIGGNREVRDKRVKKIGKSFDDNGRVLNPIFVDENFGIIDGQGRYEAARKRGMTIQYIKDASFDLKACVVLNKYNTNWSLSDYVGSYAEQGSADYRYLKILMDKYIKLSKSAVYNAVHPDLFNFDANAVKNGQFKCSTEEYNEAVKKLDYESLFLETATTIGGQIAAFLMAIGFLFDHPTVDKDKLIKRVRNHNFRPIGNINDAMKQLEDAYNKRERNPIFFEADFKYFLSKRVTTNKDLVERRKQWARNKDKSSYYN